MHVNSTPFAQFCAKASIIITRVIIRIKFFAFNVYVQFTSILVQMWWCAFLCVPLFECLHYWSVYSFAYCLMRYRSSHSCIWWSGRINWELASVALWCYWAFIDHTDLLFAVCFSASSAVKNRHLGFASGTRLPQRLYAGAGRGRKQLFNYEKVSTTLAILISVHVLTSTDCDQACCKCSLQISFLVVVWCILLSRTDTNGKVRS